MQTMKAWTAETLDRHRQERALEMDLEKEVDPMDEKDREAYIAWLRDEVEKHCNDEGRYEAYWDLRDSVSPDQIADAVEKYAKAGFASPLAYLESNLLESLGFDLEESLYVNGLLTDLAFAGEEVNRGWDDTQNVWDDLESVGYNGVDLNLDQLLGQSEFRVNVLFATEKELDADMCSIVNAFGNDYHDVDAELIDADDLDNALSYLVNQQGFSVTDVYAPSRSPFVRSVRREIAENPSDAMSELCALVSMDGHQMLDFIEKAPGLPLQTPFHPGRSVLWRSPARRILCPRRIHE